MSTILEGSTSTSPTPPLSLIFRVTEASVATASVIAIVLYLTLCARGTNTFPHLLGSTVERSMSSQCLKPRKLSLRGSMVGDGVRTSHHMKHHYSAWIMIASWVRPFAGGEALPLLLA